MAGGYKVKGPSATLPGAFDVETDDGRTFPVAPGGLPEYEAPPEIGPTVGEPTAYGDVMTIGRETVLDAGGAQPGLPPQAGGELPRLPMPPREPRKANPARVVMNDPAPQPATGEAPPAMPSADVPDGMAPDAAAAELVAEKKAIAGALGTGRWTGTPTKTEEVTSYQQRMMTPEQRAAYAAHMGRAGAAAEDAQAAADRAVKAEADAMRQKAAAIQTAQDAQAQAAARFAERQTQVYSEVDELRRKAMADDEEAEELRQRYGTADTFRRLAGAIGMFFSGGTGNPMGMMQIINANIDAEWQRDMEGLKGARAKGDRKRGYAAQLVEQLGSEEAAYQRFRAEAIQTATAESEKVALLSGSQQALERNEALKALAAQESEAAIAKSIESEAPLLQGKQTKVERKGGMVGAPSKDDVQRFRELRDTGNKEARDARSDVRKAQLDAQKPRAGGAGADDAAFRKQITTLDAAGAGLRRIFTESKKQGGLFEGDPTPAEKSSAAQLLKDAGLDEVANAAKGAKSRAEFDSIVASGMAETSRKRAAVGAMAPVSARTSQAEFEKTSRAAAGDLSAFNGKPRI